MKIKVALIGAGQRGKDIYGEYAIKNPENIEFVAVAEPNKIKRNMFAERHGINEEFIFESWEELLEKEKFCDAVVIATPDDTHFEPASIALKKGYHILLEKPMSNKADECIELGKLARENKREFLIAHVLRYTPFFSKIKEIIDSGEIGKLMTISHNENIGYFHFAHSFVRGNWRNSDLSSPLILQKSCHDMDILLWLVGSNCTNISSFGSLSYFKEKNHPEGAEERCVDCKVEAICPYSAKKLYYKNIGNWPSTVISEIQTEEAVKEAVKSGPYGRCVYLCDNNVCDHQSTILEFDNDVTVTFNLSAFTNKVHRTIRVMGTLGEIIADDSKNEIEVQLFDSNERIIYNPQVVSGGHGGGDTGIMNDFVASILSERGKGLTYASTSVESHIMAFAAEESRVLKKTIDIKEFMNK
ncbi:Gfo/Idh/MocA family protein [Senegalia massiliensis]|uniref:Gfo/Idh/MocA family protein n=1 Tax=Senegalia massiliensis TaxID=1720316 RepID=UPI0010325DCD|nr:Gfo/Idh/MocA family oxidoreductase [Senegalia massiliensis]